MAWYCPKCTVETLPFHCSDDNELFIENLKSSNIFSMDLEFIPRQGFNEFIAKCNSISNDYENWTNDEHEGLPNPINSRYHDIHLFNQINPSPDSSLGILHTNIASIGKHFDDLNSVLSLLKYKFHIIGMAH